MKGIEVYSGDPAAQPGRMECIYDQLFDRFEFVRPDPAREEDIKLVHTEGRVDYVKRLGVYENSILTAGGAIKASEIAIEGEAAFGRIRPPRPSRKSKSQLGFLLLQQHSHICREAEK